MNWHPSWIGTAKNTSRDASNAKRFSEYDILDQDMLARRIASGEDPVSVWIGRKLSRIDRHILSSGEGTVDARLKTRLILLDSLNTAVGEQSLYDSNRFRNVFLRPETMELINQGVVASNRVKFNRLLLEDVYPSGLSRPRTEPPFDWRPGKPGVVYGRRHILIIYGIEDPVEQDVILRGIREHHRENMTLSLEVRFQENENWIITDELGSKSKGREILLRSEVFRN